jgi:hypothetical protein
VSGGSLRGRGTTSSAPRPARAAILTGSAIGSWAARSSARTPGARFPARGREALEVAHALYREGSREAETFVYERAERILNGQVGQVVKGLKLIVTAVGQVDVVAHPIR